MYKKIAFFCNSNDAQLLVGKLLENSVKVNIIKNKGELEHIDNLTNIDLIIAQLSSANATELELVNYFRKHSGCSSTPLIVISSFTNREVILKSVSAGAKEFLSKPNEHDIILNKVYSILGLNSDKIGNNLKEESDFIMLSFEEVFSREVKAASRGDYPVSVALFYPIIEYNDSEINDNNFYDMLKAVLKKNLRDTDWVILYKNTVAVIMPFADIAGCNIVVERLKECYYNHAILKPFNDIYSLDAVSITFPVDGRVAHKLLEKLENSYEAKVQEYIGIA